MSDNADYTDPDVEEAWLIARRAEIDAHLRQSGGRYGGISDWPFWCKAPVTSVWGIESLISPGFLGWWAIVGDHPPECISSQNVKDPRAALEAVCNRWLEALNALHDGRPAEHGTSEDPRSIAKKLAAQIAAVRACVENDALWLVPEGDEEDSAAEVCDNDGDGDG